MNQSKLKRFITILFLLLFASTLCLDAYSKINLDFELSYELVDTEEDADTKESDTKEELKKDEYFNHLQSNFSFSKLIETQFHEYEDSWVSNIQERLLRPPMK